jgi:hypothetical protein
MALSNAELLTAYSRHYTKSFETLDEVKAALATEYEDEQHYKRELDFINSEPRQRTVKHPAVVKFIRDERLQGQAWDEIAKDVDAIFGLRRSETSMRRAVK